MESPQVGGLASWRPMTVIGSIVVAIAGASSDCCPATRGCCPCNPRTAMARALTCLAKVASKPCFDIGGGGGGATGSGA